VAPHKPSAARIQLHSMKFPMLSWIAAVFGLASGNASILQFSAITDTGEVASFTLDTSVPNTYSSTLYPNTPVRGVYLGAVHDLLFGDTYIALSDAATAPGQTGDGRLLTTMLVGPLFNDDSLSLSLGFLDSSLVSPLQPDPAVYEASFDPAVSVLFPQIPPPRTHVDFVLSLAVDEVPEPSPGVAIMIIAAGMIAVQRGRVRGLRCRSQETPSGL
jgi:hypothetical protein